MGVAGGAVLVRSPALATFWGHCGEISLG